MIIKQPLPHRSSREGFLPDRILVRACPEDAALWDSVFRREGRGVHRHVAYDGTVTEFLPLSAAADFPLGREEGIPLSRRSIVIFVQSSDGTLRPEQLEPLIRLLKRTQKEVYRIYGQALPFRSDTLLCPEAFPKVHLLEEGLLPVCDKKLYRVQTGVYRSLRDAEEHLERLGNAGIAGYITEIGVT